MADPATRFGHIAASGNENILNCTCRIYYPTDIAKGDWKTQTQPNRVPQRLIPSIYNSDRMCRGQHNPGGTFCQKPARHPLVESAPGKTENCAAGKVVSEEYRSTAYKRMRAHRAPDCPLNDHTFLPLYLGFSQGLFRFSLGITQLIPKLNLT